MSKHNYSQYSNKNNTNIDEIVAEEATIVEETPIVVEETPVDVTPVAEEDSSKKHAEPVTKTVTGIVVGCTKLNVRVKPNATADVACIVDAKSELKINETKSNKDWFYVCTVTGIEGYCMRKFVEVNL